MMVMMIILYGQIWPLSLEFVSLTVADKANPHLHKSTSCLKVKQQVRFTHFQTSEAEAVAAILLTTAHC